MIKCLYDPGETVLCRPALLRLHFTTATTTIPVSDHDPHFRNITCRSNAYILRATEKEKDCKHDEKVKVLFECGP